MLNLSPFFFASSLMLKTISIGMWSSASCVERYRLRCGIDESITFMMRSIPGFVSSSNATPSSGELEDRLYTPGMSMSSISSSPSMNSPVLLSTVTPG